MKILRFVLFTLIILSCVVIERQTFAEDNQVVWTIEIIGATGLKNTDWGPNGVSDPFVDIYIHSTNGNHFNDKTPVIFNNINPQWNYSVKREYSADETIFTAIFVVWDQDNMGNRFLGVAKIKDPIPGREYSLKLHRRKFLNTPTDPGKLLMPGILKIRVDAKYPTVKVPDIKGKTAAEAQGILKAVGLVPAETAHIIVQDKALVDKVVTQNPASGKNASLKQMVYYDVGILPTYTMPLIIGYTVSDAMRRINYFNNIHISYETPPLDMKRAKWMTVKEQSPKSGTKKVSTETPINIVVWRPPQDYKLIVPDLTGNTLSEAMKTLTDANFPGYSQCTSKKIPDKERNNKIIAQEPSPGKEIPWDAQIRIALTMGWYANGKSLYAARLTNLDEPFEETFDTSGDATYRLVKINKPGYLILKEIHGPDNVNPQAMYYYYPKNKGWQKAEDRWFYLPSAQRVTPGEWIVQIAPEMRESVSNKPCKFEFSFIPEFDPSEPNNSMDEAVDISPNAELIVGFMGSYDHDVYSFKVDKPGYMEVVSERLPSEIVDTNGLDVSYDLYNEKKEKIGFYYMPSASYLLPGKYYIDFSAAEDSWSRLRYRLTMRFHPAVDIGEPNDTKETAYEVGVGATIPVAYSINDKDYYRIKSDEPGYAVLSHDSDIPFDVNFYRYDANGEKTGPRLQLPAAVKIDTVRLISLEASSEAHFYLIDPPVNLQIGFISAKEDKFEPNDTPQQASVVGLNQEIYGLLMPRFELDNYSFTVKKPGVMYFDLTKPKGEDVSIKGRLLSSDGKTVVVDNLYLPCEVNIDKPGKYILQFGQEPGLQRLCDKQYKLVIRDGKRELAYDNKIPSERYGKKCIGDCLDSAKQAYKFLQKAQYRQAKDLYAQALQCASKNAVVWNDYAVSSFNLKETKIAEESLAEAIKLNPDYDLAYRNLAVVNWQKGDNAKGAELMAKAVTLKASDENLRYAAHAYILLSKEQKGQNKIQSLKKAAEYYRKMKNIPESSRDNLDKIEKYLKGEIALPEK